jgi:hypothetical protein
VQRVGVRDYRCVAAVILAGAAGTSVGGSSCVKFDANLAGVLQSVAAMM